jgi:hypothetical protein
MKTETGNTARKRKITDLNSAAVTMFPLSVKGKKKVP